MLSSWWRGSEPLLGDSGWRLDWDCPLLQQDGEEWTSNTVYFPFIVDISPHVFPCAVPHPPSPVPLTPQKHTPSRSDWLALLYGSASPFYRDMEPSKQAEGELLNFIYM